jgi:hypothetical protein
MMQFMIKAWVRSFFSFYSGLFFVMILILFGIFRGNEHLAIAHFIVSSPANLLYLVFLFLPNGLLLISFNSRFLMDKRNIFIFDLIHLPSFTRLLLILNMIFLTSVPVLVYMVFLFAVSLADGVPESGGIILIMSFLYILILALPVFYRLIHPVEKTFGSGLSIPVPGLLNNRLVVLVIKDLFLNRTISVLLTKSLSFLLLIVATIIISTVDEYARFLSISIFLTLMANAYLAWEMHSFIQYRLNFIRNLPVPVPVFWFHTFLITAFFILPEAIYIFRNFHAYFTLSGLITYIFLGIANLMLIHSLLLVRGFYRERFIPRLFWLLLGIFFMLLFDVPALLISVFLLILSFIIYKRYFYRFEQEFVEKNQYHETF